MRIKQASQIDIEDVLALEEFVLISASGFESRATLVSEKLSDKTSEKYVISFKDKLDIYSRIQNDTYFKDRNFETIISDGDEHKEIVALINKLLLEGKKKMNIVVDYSCMTRVWYASIIKYFKDLSIEKSETEIILYFCYSKAEYQPANEEGVYNRHVGPIDGFSNISTPDKPTALIIGLGFERTRAYGLREYLDAYTYLFCTSPKTGGDFSHEVQKKNEELINSVKPENVYFYDIDNLNYTLVLLKNLIEDLQSNFRVIVAPCGPKPFTLISLITATFFNSIDVWRISAGKDILPVNWKPNGEILAFRIKY